MDDFEVELRQGFLEEATDLLSDAEAAFLELESNREDPELINQIFRLAHNLKGTSRAVGFGEVAEFTHSWENLILKIKDSEVEASDAIVSLLLECNDHVNGMISALTENLEATFDSAALIAKLEKAQAGELSSEKASEASPNVHAEVDASGVQEDSAEELNSEKVPEVETKGDEVAMSTQVDGLGEELRDLIDESSESEVGEKTNESTNPVGFSTVDSDITDAAGGTQVTQKANPQAVSSGPPTVAEPKKIPSKKKDDEVLRVALSKIAKINDAVGELVILQTVLSQRKGLFIKDELSNKSITQLGKLSKEIQELSMGLRMVPLKSTFQKMTRIVRDTSKALGKTINLELVGEETEVDKSVLEMLSDPLVHIIRNSVDHGIEDAEKRLNAGKSEAGNVTLRAFHESKYLVIEIIDDGGGIHPDVIRKKCLEKGIISESASISDEEIVQYIFNPGFSTKEQVTEVSGRGVGMDVVKTNIESLSGTVGVKTKVGLGSTFRITLPLTMAIIEAMVVSSKGHRFIIPLTQVYESIKADSKVIQQISGVGPCLNLRGEVIPVYSLASALKIMASKEDQVEDTTLIICRDDVSSFAVEVDEILHQQQVVIKRLGEEIRDQKGLMGGSILGDGRPALIVDLFDLLDGTKKTFKQTMSLEKFGDIAG